MNSNYVKVTGLSRVMPAEYLAQWNGRPLRIELDTGATLRLLGKCDSDHRSDVLSGKVELIETTAQRLIDMRLEKPADDHAVVMISVLDLEASPQKADVNQNTAATNRADGMHTAISAQSR